MTQLDGSLAKRHLSYMRKWPWSRRALHIVGRDDALQNIWLAWLELGRPHADGVNRDVLRVAWNLILHQYYRMGRELLDDRPDARPHPMPPPEHAWLQHVLHHYEAHTADATIACFNLPDTARVRRWLGRCMPKHHRAGGKRYKELRQKVKTTATSSQLIAMGVPRATAWRAAQRGYYWEKVGADRKTGPKALTPRR